MTPALRPGLFSIETVQGPYTGWTTGEVWNGWACPYFEIEVARRVAADYASANAAEGATAEFDENTNAFRFLDPVQGEWEVYEGFEEDGRMLYPIGTQYWTWTEVTAS